jgi:hypothetical protein
MGFFSFLKGKTQTFPIKSEVKPNLEGADFYLARDEIAHIRSNRKYPFGTIITLMRTGELDFAISTAKEGVFKGLTTYIQIPVHNIAAKIFYMPSMNKQAIHLLHEKLVMFIEEQLNSGYPLVLIIDLALKMIKECGYTLEIVTANWFKDLVSEIKNKE